MHVNIRYKLILYKDVGTRLGLNAKIWVKGGKGNGQTGAGRRASNMMRTQSATNFHKKTNKKMMSVVLRFNKKTTIFLFFTYHNFALFSTSPTPTKPKLFKP